MDTESTPWVSYFSTSESPYTGVVANYSTVVKIIDLYERATTTKFIKTKRPKGYAEQVEQIEDGYNLFGKAQSFLGGSTDNNWTSIAFLGVPFMFLGSEVRACQHGHDRHRKYKRQYREKKLHQKVDHAYNTKNRRLVQNTKKQDCPASIRIRGIVKFPKFQIADKDSSWKRKNTSAKLRKSLASGGIDIEVEFHVSLPRHTDHKFHLIGEKLYTPTELLSIDGTAAVCNAYLAGISQPIDHHIISKIRQLVGEGVKKVTEMKRHLDIYVHNDLLKGEQISPFNRWFFPLDRDIRNHIYRALVMCRFSNEDQDNLGRLIDLWKQESPQDQFFYRSCTNVTTNCGTWTDDEVEIPREGFLFIHQSDWQKKLLLRYGEEICMMDATYKTSRYDLPLFFICVNTNVGNTIVASFILPDENRDNIKEALGILAGWNPGWLPRHFMCDFDEREIWAIESTFEGCLVYLCDFHREQSWDRWLKDAKNGLREHQTEILKLLRAIAGSCTEQEFDRAVNALQASQWWGDSNRLRSWFGKKWLSHSRRWVQAFGSELFNVRMTTTNGLERQHHDLKKSYLAHYSEGTLSSMVTTLLKKFLPDSRKRYLEYNTRSLNLYRKYSSHIPEFLRNRPKFLVEHCMSRLPPNVTSIPIENITHEEDRSFHIIRKTYEVTFDQPMPFCSCEDWRKHHLPCKHILSIILIVEGYGWEALPSTYRDSPYFCLDPELFVEVSQMQNSQQNTIVESSDIKTTEETNSPSTPVTHVSYDQLHANAEVTHSGATSKVTFPLENKKLLSQCLKSAKNIYKNLFNIPEHQDLQHIKDALSELEKQVESLLVYENGLPLLRNTHNSKKNFTSKNTKIVGKGLRKLKKGNRKLKQTQ